MALDPTKRKTGGALLGDRIRMNALQNSKIYMRSIATRGAEKEIVPALKDMIAACKVAGYELIIVETPGIGQGNAAITEEVDFSLYVMTPEYGAASQLEKIDMLDFADLVAINKFDRKGAQDALRDVRKQVQRNLEAFASSPEDMPVFGTMASRFNDSGVTALYHALLEQMNQKNKGRWSSQLEKPLNKMTDIGNTIVPPDRTRYLAELSETVRSYKKKIKQQAQIAREIQHLESAKKIIAQHELAHKALDESLEKSYQQFFT